jgi:hypothetical protein
MRRESSKRWYGDVRFKQLSFTEFLVAEYESVTNIYKRLKNVYDVNAVDKSTVSRLASRIPGSEKGEAELCHARRSGRPTIAVSQTLLQYADDLIRNDRVQPEILQLLSIQEKCEKHYCLRIFKSVCSLGPAKPNRLSQNCRKRCSDLFSRYEASGESLGDRHRG